MIGARQIPRFFGPSLRVVLACILPATCSGLAQAQSDLGEEDVKRLVSAADADRPRLTDIVRAKDKAELAGQAQPPSAVGKIVYAASAYRLRMKGADLLVLRSLPKSAAEMEAFYEFTQEPGSREILPLYRHFYTAAFHSVITNSDYLPQVFAVATGFDTRAWPNYDDTDWLCGQLAAVSRAIPGRYAAAASHEGGADRRLLERCARSAP